MTDVPKELLVALLDLGLPAHEARWLIEEFAPGADPAARSDVMAAAERRRQGEPLQYIIGHWPFRSLDVDVDPRVLIPRPETEELVDHALAALAVANVTAPLVVDLGCGSGVIGLSLLVELEARGVTAQLLAVDASADALAVARRNAIKHRCLRVSFVESDWFSALDPSLRGRVDLLVSNPPYVSDEDYESLATELYVEPRRALTAPSANGVGGFADLARIIAQAPAWLAPHGVLVLEHGHDQGDAAVAAARAAGFRAVIDHHDLAGHARVLVATDWSA